MKPSVAKQPGTRALLVSGLILAAAALLGLAAAWLSSTSELDAAEGSLRSLTLALTGRMRELARAPGPFLSAVVVAVGFLYGILHGAMPGHRKAILVSYFAGRDVRPVDALSTGLTLGVLHCLLASAIVLASWQLLTVSFGQGVSWTALWMERAAAAVLLLVGVQLLRTRAPAFAHSQQRIDDPARFDTTFDLSTFTRAPKRDYAARGAGRWSLLLGAIIPCPGSSLLMVFAVSIGAPLAGILAVSGMALGMGLTLALVALSSVVVRRHVLLRARPDTMARLHRILDRSTAVFILAFASGILFGL